MTDAAKYDSVLGEKRKKITEGCSREDIKLKAFQKIVAITVFGLSGCTYVLEETCGRPLAPGGNQCCAVGTLDIENNFQAKNFSCEPSNNECKDAAVTSAYPAHKFPFQPSANYRGNSAFEGGCASVKWKKKSSLSFASDSQSIEPLVSTGAFVPIDEPLNCLERCNYDFPNGSGGGNPALCPGINIEPNVASALFFFYSDVDPSKYPDTENVVPIRDILAKFSVAEDELKECPRGDVKIYSDGRVVNSGDACPAFSSFSVQGQSVSSELGVASTLLGNFETQSQNDALMTYPNMSETFDLAHDQPAYDALYGGKIRKSGRLYDSAVAEILNRQNLKTCARANSQFALSDEEEFLLQDASEDELSSLIGAVLEKLQPRLKAEENPTSMQKFRPVYAAFESLAEDERDQLANSLSAFTLSSTDVEKQKLLLPLVKWLDASICNTALFEDGAIQHEYADGYRAELLLGENIEARDIASTEFLRCVSVDGFVSEEFSAAVSEISGDE